MYIWCKTLRTRTFGEVGGGRDTIFFSKNNFKHFRNNGLKCSYFYYEQDSHQISIDYKLRFEFSLSQLTVNFFVGLLNLNTVDKMRDLSGDIFLLRAKSLE